MTQVEETRMSAGALRFSLTAIARNIKSTHKHIVFTRYGRDLLALIPIEDYIWLKEHKNCDGRDGSAH